MTLEHDEPLKSCRPTAPWRFSAAATKAFSAPHWCRRRTAPVLRPVRRHGSPLNSASRTRTVLPTSGSGSGALTWKVKLYTHLETDLLGELRDGAETEAINVFAHNLHDLLAALAGPRATLGLTGPAHRLQGRRGRRHRQAVDHATVYPHVPHNSVDQTSRSWPFCAPSTPWTRSPSATVPPAVETDKLAAELIKIPAMKMTKVMVSEAGASVYSAPGAGVQGIPDLDVDPWRRPSPVACRIRWPSW